MGAELLSPFAMWGAALIAAGGAAWFIHRGITRSARNESELAESKEVLSALDRARAARERVRRLSRRDRIDRM